MDDQVVVIGGGISGLSFAYRAAAAGQRVLLLEGSTQFGGCIHSARHAADYWLEVGAHTCYNSYGGLIEMVESCGMRDKITARERVPFRLLRDGALRSIPGELSLFELARSIPRIFNTRKEGQTVEAYYSRLAGAGNYRRVLSAMFAAVPSQNADGFPAGMLFKKRSRRKDILRSFTLAGGLQTLPDALARRPGLEAVTDVEVNRVEKTGSSFRVHSADERCFPARTLVLAVAPPQAAALLREAAPELAAQLARIQTSTADSVGVVVAAQKLAIPPVAGVVATDDIFFSAVSRDTVPDPRYRGFAFHFRPGSSAEDRLERIARVLEVEQRDLEVVSERQVRLPSPVLGHAEIVREIDRMTAGTRLAVTGNFFDGLALEDCVSRSFDEAARLFGPESLDAAGEG